MHRLTFRAAFAFRFLVYLRRFIRDHKLAVTVENPLLLGELDVQYLVMGHVSLFKPLLRFKGYDY